MRISAIKWWVAQYKIMDDKVICKNFAREDLTDEEYTEFLIQIGETPA